MPNLKFQCRKLFRHQQEKDQEQEPVEDADAHQPEAEAAQPEAGPRKQQQQQQNVNPLLGGVSAGPGRPGRLQVCHGGGEGGGQQLRQPDLELRRAADDREVLHRPGK